MIVDLVRTMMCGLPSSMSDARLAWLAFLGVTT